MQQLSWNCVKKCNPSNHKLLAIDDHSCIQYYTQLHNNQSNTQLHNNQLHNAQSNIQSNIQNNIKSDSSSETNDKVKRKVTKKAIVNNDANTEPKKKNVRRRKTTVQKNQTQNSKVNNEITNDQLVEKSTSAKNSGSIKKSTPKKKSTQKNDIKDISKTVSIKQKKTIKTSSKSATSTKPVTKKTVKKTASKVSNKANTPALKKATKVKGTRSVKTLIKTDFSICGEDTIPSDLEVRPLFIHDEEIEEHTFKLSLNDLKNVSFFYCYKNDSLAWLELNFHKFNMFDEVQEITLRRKNHCQNIYSCLSKYMYVEKQDNILRINIHDLNVFLRLLDEPLNNVNIKFLNDKGILESTIFFKHQNSKLYTYIKPAFDNLASIIINQCDNVLPYIDEIEQLRRQIHLNLNTNILLNYIIQYYYSSNSHEKMYPEKRRKDF